MPARGDALRAAALAGAGAAPFLAARVLDGPALLCPFRAATGLPCPLCGATRAVELAAHGDPAFLDFGAVWVVVLAGFVVAGLLTAAGRRVAPRPAAILPAGLVVLGAAWAWALAHAGTIAPGPGPG